eukprot:GHVR01110469.1.p1 GENE.GHVR01110469.1~~GHVR01110469.1.p1  ORF type:complete len:120 (+),score=10.14 GHVR01110469.1:210-569(+)
MSLAPNVIWRPLFLLTIHISRKEGDSQKNLTYIHNLQILPSQLLKFFFSKKSQPSTFQHTLPETIDNIYSHTHELSVQPTGVLNSKEVALPEASSPAPHTPLVNTSFHTLDCCFCLAYS